ncbi:MAG: SRPBCC domain-containing protein [Woeseia sp.]|nr:SRPBCC domain-containing protein [Woeseia sp.]
MANNTAGINALQMAIQINATTAQVWQALTADIGAWWPAEFYAGGDSGKRNFVLEAEPGGRMYEDWQDGGGVLWATVVTVDPGKRLQVTGSVFPNWGGPTQWFGSWELSNNEEGTLLKFEDHSIGRMSADGAAEKHKGWQSLWDVLKARLEGKPAPSWPD